MIMIRIQQLSIAFALLGFFHASAMVYDNRFMPLYARNYPRTCERPSALMVDGFIMTGNDAFPNEDADDVNEEGLFTMFGRYNQTALANAIVALGLPNPYAAPGDQILTRFEDVDVFWDMHGKLQTQGVALNYDQHIGGWFSTGFNCFFMHLFSRNNFILNSKSVTSNLITPAEAVRLDQVRRQMNSTIGLVAPCNSVAGFSDIDWYIRAGNIWEYSCKCKRIDAGIRVGALIPSGLCRDISDPASIPFGGNGLWGVYGAGDFEIELKQDWEIGVLLRVSQRFAKTKVSHIPIADEQQLYGATSGNLKTNPGVTFVFSPYFRFEGIRDGLGIQGRFTLVVHNYDGFIDERAVKSPAATLDPMKKYSMWKAEYLTVDAFYDFAKVRLPYSFAPVLSVKWDIPIKLFIASRAAKTNRLSVGIIFNF